MKRLSIIINLFLLFGHAAISQDGLSKAESFTKQANYQASNNLLDNFIQQNTSRLYDLSSAWFLKSYNAMQLGDYSEALEANKQSADLKRKLHTEDIAENYIQEGAIYLLMGEYDRALDVLTLASEFPIEDPQTYALLFNYIAAAHQHLGHFELAVQRLTESLEIVAFELGEDHPDFAARNYELGRLYAKMGKKEKAKTAWKKTIRAAENLEYGSILKARVFKALGLLYPYVHWKKVFEAYISFLL